MCEGLLESEGKSLFDEVERQDSRIQREIAAAEMERMWLDYSSVAGFWVNECTISYLKSEIRTIPLCKVRPRIP